VLLNKAVVLSNQLKVISCGKAKKNNQIILSGTYSTPLTVRTGNHIPYSAVYKHKKLQHIMFFSLYTLENAQHPLAEFAN